MASIGEEDGSPRKKGAARPQSDFFFQARWKEKGRARDPQPKGRSASTAASSTDDPGPIGSTNRRPPRTHGSACVPRAGGGRRALVPCTLSTAGDAQKIRDVRGRGTWAGSFMLHYKFPAFSGSAKPAACRGRARRGNRATARLRRSASGSGDHAPPRREFPLHCPIVLREILREQRARRFDGRRFLRADLSLAHDGDAGLAAQEARSRVSPWGPS